MSHQNRTPAVPGTPSPYRLGYGNATAWRDFVLTSDIIQNELLHVYEQKSSPRDELDQANTGQREQRSQHIQSVREQRDDAHSLFLMLAATHLLHQMSRTFQENALPRAQPGRTQIDRKRLRQLQEKRIAMGHKPDGHEEQSQSQTMAMGSFMAQMMSHSKTTESAGQNTKLPIRRFLALSRYFAVWVTVWVRLIDPHFDPHKIGAKRNKNS